MKAFIDQLSASKQTYFMLGSKRITRPCLQTRAGGLAGQIAGKIDPGESVWWNVPSVFDTSWQIHVSLSSSLISVHYTEVQLDFNGKSPLGLICLIWAWWDDHGKGPIGCWLPRTNIDTQAVSSLSPNFCCLKNISLIWEKENNVNCLELFQ